ncbi:hypothetical protein [Auraticoccus monumenti]|uniref:Uncharacterized protein n=1 Tax=Auraticoccus monumenti TaxID=675864 RepID=A0A1G6XDI0_9ACTN|nr:hypothetical protein [Auraticoccus monumenti]SDD76131.1 hypothetical protein SAMN04489747_1679 [Auraticoccus monumenti]
MRTRREARPRREPALLGRATAVLATALVVAVGGLATPAADAAGSTGVCTEESGVTVVVDLRALGGGTVVRCAGDVAGGTGLDALQAAGFDTEGVRRWGDAFVCRLHGRPGATEELAVPGRSGYTERCIDTPPATAYWSYWHATDGGSWTYSQQGLTQRRVVAGGFEGWSFSLGSGDASAPGVTPVRPAAPEPEQPRRDDPPRPADQPDPEAPGREDDSTAPEDAGSTSGPASAPPDRPGDAPRPADRAPAEERPGSERAGSAPPDVRADGGREVPDEPGRPEDTPVATPSAAPSGSPSPSASPSGPATTPSSTPTPAAPPTPRTGSAGAPAGVGPSAGAVPDAVPVSGASAAPGAGVLLAGLAGVLVLGAAAGAVVRRRRGS